MDEVLSSSVGVEEDRSIEDCDPGEEEEGENENKVGRKKKNKRRKGLFPFFIDLNIYYTALKTVVLELNLCIFSENSENEDGEYYPVDIWLLLASYIRPEDVCKFALICKNAWTVTCTAAFWTRLYRRCLYFLYCFMFILDSK